MSEQNVALNAYGLAVEAKQQIESHEATCAQRWGVVVRVALLQLGALLAVFGTLVADKLL